MCYNEKSEKQMMDDTYTWELTFYLYVSRLKGDMRLFQPPC